MKYYLADRARETLLPKYAVDRKGKSEGEKYGPRLGNENIAVEPQERKFAPQISVFFAEARC